MKASNEIAASVDEIADSILRQLKPWRKGIPRTEILAAVRERIDLLQSCKGEFFNRDAVRRTRDKARSIDEAITRLELELQHLSPEMQMRLAASLPRALTELQSMREECTAAITASLTEGRNDQTKKWCASSAWGLMIQFSTRKPSSTENSKYRVIASLLYGAISGKRDVNFRRACNDHLKRMRPLQKRHPKLG